MTHTQTSNLHGNFFCCVVAGMWCTTASAVKKTSRLKNLTRKKNLWVKIDQSFVGCHIWGEQVRVACFRQKRGDTVVLLWTSRIFQQPMATGRIFDGPISIRLSGPSRHQSSDPAKLIFCLFTGVVASDQRWRMKNMGPKCVVFFEKVHPIFFSDEIALSTAIGTAISRQPLRVSSSKQFRPLHAPALHQVHKWVVSQTDPRDSWMTEQQLGPSLDHVTAFVCFVCVEKNNIQTLLSNSHSKRIWVKKLTFSIFFMEGFRHHTKPIVSCHLAVISTRLLDRWKGIEGKSFLMLPCHWCNSIYIRPYWTSTE